MYFVLCYWLGNLYKGYKNRVLHVECLASVPDFFVVRKAAYHRFSYRVIVCNGSTAGRFVFSAYGHPCTFHRLPWVVACLRHIACCRTVCLSASQKISNAYSNCSAYEPDTCFDLHVNHLKNYLSLLIAIQCYYLVCYM